MIIVVDPDRTFRARVAEQLGRRGDLLEAERLKEAEGLVAEKNGSLSVLLLGPGLAATSALNFAGAIQASAPEVSVVFVGRSLDQEILQRAVHAGVKDVLPASFTPQQLTKAIAHAEAVAHQLRERQTGSHNADEKAPHSMISVISSKGGVGKSFLSSNLAVLLAQKGTCAIVDLDLQSGDLAIMLQLFPTRTICDATADLDRLDEEALRAYLTPHRTKVQLLAGPVDPSLADTVSPEAVQAVLRILKGMFRFVIVDTPPMFNDHVLSAIDESDLIVSITTMDVPSIKNMRASLQALDMLGVPRERRRIVLNRADSKVGLGLAEVEKTLETKVDASIPSSREVPFSINRGTPIVVEQPKSPVTKALAELADRVAQSVGVSARPTQAKAKDSRFHLGRKS